MTRSIDRRSFLLNAGRLATVASAAGLQPLAWSRALAAPAATLKIERRTIEVKGKAASVFGIRQADGTPGISLEPGIPFRVDLVNGAAEDTIIHWHGQRPPYLQDGVADANISLIKPAASQSYDYVPAPGTHWMHSHHGLQEQALMAAPLVARTSEEVKADVQELTVLLHDFSFRDPAEIFAGLGGAAGGHDMGAMAGAGNAAGASGMAGMDHSKMNMGSQPGMGSGMNMPMAMDLNDVEYDAFLANDRTLDDPLVVRVERKGRLRIRLINGAASSAMWIDLGALKATLVAVDGNPVKPVAGSRFPMTMAQRLDLMVDVPAGSAHLVSAQVEGKGERTGFILAAPGAKVEKFASLAAAVAPPVDLSLETNLRAVTPLPKRAADAALTVALTGVMSPYSWSINGQSWPKVDRPVIGKGQRIAIDLQNRTMMAHPMHLHGHHFQVVGINGRELAGAVRDTVLVPVMGRVRIEFDADNPGRWPLHCHNLYHMASGMMTELIYDTFA